LIPADRLYRISLLYHPAPKALTISIKDMHLITPTTACATAYQAALVHFHPLIEVVVFQSNAGNLQIQHLDIKIWH
jgi:hypothetical protein